MKNHFFLLLGLLISFNCFASGNAYIKGVVVDSKTKEVMEYVTVGLCKVGEEAPISGTITDYSGAFILTNVEAGNYIVKISFMGYVPQEKRVYVNDNSQVVRLGRIELVEDSQTIEGTEIVAQGTQMRFEVDKKVFNVDQNIASNGGSASEVLSNIPSVEVDNEGEISLRGSSDVTVWINGKASGLTADNRAQILEQLPAESIEKIEVITNPSAKYSPEGTSGIINIVLKKDRKVGYYGSVQAGADSRGGYNASGNINYNSGKWEAYANVGFRRRVNVGGEYTNRINLDENGDSISYINQESESSRKGYHLFGRAGTTYNFSNNDHLSLDVMGMFGKSTNSTVNDYIGNVPTSYLTSTRETASDGRNFGGNASLTYKHEFGNDHNLTLSASYFNWNMKNQSHYSQYSLYPNDEYISSYQLQKSVVGGPNWEFQADYVYKISDKHKIEAGYKGEISDEDSPVETYSGTSIETIAFDTLLYNRFIYNRNVHALYATYAGRVGNFGYSAGLRGEYTGIRTKSLAYDDEYDDVDLYKIDYYSLFPSLYLTYSLPKGNEIQLNYTRRISRPRGHQLNSFVDLTDTLNISFGNPELKPQFSHALELNYIKSWEKHTISFSAYYRQEENVIQRIRYRDGLVMKSTFENITQSQATGAELVVKNSLFKILDLTTTLNAYYSQLDGFSYYPNGDTSLDPVVGESSHGFSWDAKMIANFALPYSMSLQITGRYNSPSIVAQGKRDANYALDAGFKKSFFNRRLSLSLSARDILDSRKWHTYTYGDGFIQDYCGWRGGREFRLTATWSFGNMKSNKKPSATGTSESMNTGYEDDSMGY